MANTYDSKAIVGADLKEVLKNVAADINTKQDILDIKYDAANCMFVLNNVDIQVLNPNS